MKTCKYCGGDIAIRNPTGNCDHLYYPENVNKSLKPPTPKITNMEKVFNVSPNPCKANGSKRYSDHARPFLGFGNDIYCVCGMSGNEMYEEGVASLSKHEKHEGKLSALGKIAYLIGQASDLAKKEEFARIKAEMKAYRSKYPGGSVLTVFLDALENGESFIAKKKGEIIKIKSPLDPPA